MSNVLTSAYIVGVNDKINKQNQHFYIHKNAKLYDQGKTHSSLGITALHSIGVNLCMTTKTLSISH